MPSTWKSTQNGGSENPNLVSTMTNTIGETSEASPRNEREQGNIIPVSKLPVETVPSSNEENSEFQEFAASFSGRVLPVFGASLFEKVPSTFAPLDRVPVPSDYVIGPGDEILLHVWGQINLSQRLTVDRSGDVFIPDVGSINLIGVRFSMLESVLKNALKGVFRNFDLTATLGHLRAIRILVSGEARQPGSYTVSSLSTLLNALFTCGGPSSSGSMRHIQLKRGDKIITDFDLYDLMLHGDKSHDVPLQPGDVLWIAPMGAQVAITGSVIHPAIYELRGRVTLGKLLEMSGGLSPVAASRRAILQRINSHSVLQSHMILMDDAGLNTLLQNGDIVQFLAIVPRFAEVVTLVGNVPDPGRFPWFPGMRIRDLIPNKEALLTRDFWRQRNKLSAEGTISHEAKRFGSDAPLASVQSEHLDAFSDSVSTDTVHIATPEINWDYAAIERINPNTLAPFLIPFHLGQAMVDTDETNNLLLNPGDKVTIFSVADVPVPEARKTKFVTLQGEIRFPGTYTPTPNETLRQLVKGAGGLTPDAYLYGAQFTRVSTKNEQQRRKAEYLDTIEQSLEQGAISRVTQNESTSAQESAIAAERISIARLRRTEATGRIVLEFSPTSEGLTAIPEIPLENGDKLLVSSRPISVNVVGNVYNEGSFLYREAYRLRDYLAESGGPRHYSDVRHIFVIRADGSVDSPSSQLRAFSKPAASLAIFPGDTIVVPSYLPKPSLIRGLIDWSQVFSSLTLGAAAINVIR